MAKRYIAYYRVSTQKQGESGLGLEAQQEAVRGYLGRSGLELVEEYTEIESGKRKDRPALTRALQSCRIYGATLIIAKLDRLARNVAFTANLMDAGVDFVAVDNPHASRLTIHILAAVAEDEALRIAARTKAALAAAKARGQSLGGLRVSPERFKEISALGRLTATRHRQQSASERAINLMPAIEDLKYRGCKTLRELANGLNKRGIATNRGKQWTAMQVSRVLQRGNVARGTLVP